MNKVKFLVAALLGVLFVACSEEENLSQTSKTGFLVSLTEDVKVDSRKTPEELGKPAASQFKLKITNQTTGSELYSGSYTEDLIPASAGMYEIEATYGEDLPLALDAPYYKGTAEADLADGESKTVQVNCKVANALASVTFDNSGTYRFDEQFSSYGVRVTLPDASTVITDNGQSAYYQAGSKPVFVFEGKTDNQTVEVPLDNSEFSKDSTFAAGAHCIISLKLGATSSGVRVEIAKVEVQEVTINETIPMEWLPKPKVTATGFGSNNTLSFVETETPEAKLSLNLSSALQDIKFKFNFEDEQFAFEDREYLLSTDKETIEQALDVTLPSVGDKPESIDLGGLIAKLQTNAGVPTNNSIEIDVQANNRWSSEDAEANRVYTLTCNKPEFSIAVQEGNVWTKTFTIDEAIVTTGNAEVLKEKLVYQYKEKDAGDDAWQTCSNGLEQVFSEHPAGKDYEVRAFYREGIVSNVVNVTLETPTQLPNSGFEDWYEEDQSDHKNLWFPYVEGATGLQWTTNNLETTHSSSDAWDSPSAVKRTTIKNSGSYAAWIRTVGHGNTNTNVGSFLGINGSITGTETIGILSYSGAFAVRPTKISFNYRYIQKGDDAGVVKLKIENQEQNAILFETSFTVTNTDYIRRDIPIDYSITNIPATHMTLTFKSGSKHTEVVKAKVRGNNIDGTEADEHYGSEFYIDDIELIYDK